MNSPKKKDNKSKAQCNERPKRIQIQTKPRLDFLKNCRKMQSIISQVTTSKCPSNYWWCPTALPSAFFSAPLFFCLLQSGTLPMTTPHRHQRWCVVSLHNQGTAVLIPNVGRGGGAYFTVFSLLFFSLLLTHRQLILAVMTGLVLWLMIQASTLLQLTSSWSAKPSTSQ